MTAIEMAKLYYPKLWSLERLNNLVEKGKLTQEFVDELVASKTEK